MLSQLSNSLMSDTGLLQRPQERCLYIGQQSEEKYAHLLFWEQAVGAA